MRDIKFRGKNKDIGWVYGQLAYDINGNTYIIQEVELDSSYGLEETMLFATMWYRVDKETLGQYIGLKDKMEKEIYEGDIVLYQDWEQCYEGGGNDSFINKGIVEYNEGNCCFNVTERETIDIEDVLYKGNEDLEVIGNIYDNPKLLEEGE